MIDAMAGAGDYAGWLQPTIQPIHTQIAFLGYEFLPIKLHHSKLGMEDGYQVTVRRAKSV